MSETIADTDWTSDWPYQDWQLLTLAEAAELLNTTIYWFKRARTDELLEFIKLRGELRIRVGELRRFIRENTTPAKPYKPIRRKRSAEHNRKIGEAVRRANQRKNA